MDPVTDLIRKARDETLSVSDYSQYRKACTSKLVQLRRKLRIITPKGRKYEPKALKSLYENDAEHFAEWREYLIFLSERPWAHAMAMKSLQTAETGDATLSGPTRAHIISRLAKASRMAAHLASLLEKQSEVSDHIAASAYRRSLEGALAFESQQWEKCLAAFSDVHVMYTALGQHKKQNAYSDWISENVEPSLRYAAYQQRLSRTMTAEKIVARYVSRDSVPVKEALKVAPLAITGDKSASTSSSTQPVSQDELPSSIAWRGRTVKLEDARIAQALASVTAAEETISKVVSSSASASEKAAAFEEVLTKSQDTVDATKSAIDELSAEGAAPSDPRMQALQITHTAVSYDLIGWRIGRNRVLCGPDDGTTLQAEAPRKPRGKKENVPQANTEPREEGVGRKMARLRERVVLYDAIIQDINTIEKLPGVPGDPSLLKKLVSRKGYFSALRCVAIARSHALQDNLKHALAIFARAQQHASVMDTLDDDEDGASSAIPRHFVTSTEAKTVREMAQELVQRYRALVEMDNLDREAIKAEKAKAAWNAPLIERMDEYPAGGADLTNLVTYPPKLRPVPVKPIFLDLAWNYIEYPGRTRSIIQNSGTVPDDGAEDEQPAKKRGWFGFGRS